MKFKILLLAIIIAIFNFLENKCFSQSLKTGPVVYEQISGFDYSQFPISVQSFVATNAGSSMFTCQLADDFTVPAGETWEIATVKVYGKYDNNVTLDSVNIFIYADDVKNSQSKSPGAPLHSFTEIIDIENHACFDEYGGLAYRESNIKLPTILTLTEGKYWISIQAIRDADWSKDGMYSLFIHSDGSVTYGEPVMGKNPENGHWWNAVDWTPIYEIRPDATSFNLTFGLYAQALDNDLGIESIDAPASGGAFTNSELVSVSIGNFGTLAQSNFDVRYSINGGTWVTETVTGELAAGETMNYTFNTTADLSNVGTYTITAEVLLATDGYAVNNTLTKEAKNYGVVHVFGQEETITGCGEYFSDPGGPANKWTAPVSGDTVTLYPTGPDQRLWLYFEEFNNGHDEFNAYDGEDVNAPQIDLSPGNPWTMAATDFDLFEKYIKATNAAGAITITWNGAYFGSADGWLAEMQCITPPNDDFWLKTITKNNDIIFTNEEVTFSVEVFNYGLSTQSKTVTFTVNGTELGSVTSSELNSSETEILTFSWIPVEMGSYNVIASINEDGGDDSSNNSVAIQVDVYMEGSLVESFEGDNFPPDFWTFGSEWSVSESEWLAGFHGKKYVTTFITDTIITPQLIINDGDSISFLAGEVSFNAPILDLYWGESKDGPWTLIESISLQGGDAFNEFSVDISDAVGNNFIAFIVRNQDPEIPYADGFLDFIRGPKIYYFNNDIMLKNFTGELMPEQYDTASYHVEIKNTGLNDINDGDYTIKLLMKGESDNIEIGSIQGKALGSMETRIDTIEYSFQDFGHQKIFATIEFSNDEEPLNNTSDELEINVLSFGTEKEIQYDASNYQIRHPFRGSDMGEISEVLYFADSIRGSGTINGITYWYENTTQIDFDNIPVSIYLGETTDTTLSSRWWSADELTLVYKDSTDNFVNGKHPYTFKFQVPYVYDGENNLIVAVVHNAKTMFEAQLSWLGGETSIENVSRRASDFMSNIGTDSASLSQLYTNVESIAPKTQFHINRSGLGEIAGYVQDEQGNPLEGVYVKLDGYDAEDVTNANGYYKLGKVPASDSRIISANAFGYKNNIDTVIVVEGCQSELNLLMELKPKSSVTGKVVRSDDNSAISEIDVALAGYDNYTVQTDAQGSFLINDVFANETYEITINSQEYEEYADTNVVVAENQVTDLGTIVMQVIATSNQDIFNANSVNLYPNPTNGVSVIKNAAGSTISVYSITGRMIESFNVEYDEQRIDFSGYKEGTYIIRVQSINDVQDFKIIITR